MVATRPIGTIMRYRLLDTTRSYALTIGADEDELSAWPFAIGAAAVDARVRADLSVPA